MPDKVCLTKMLQSQSWGLMSHFPSPLSSPLCLGYRNSLTLLLTHLCASHSHNSLWQKLTAHFKDSQLFIV